MRHIFFLLLVLCTNNALAQSYAEITGSGTVTSASAQYSTIFSAGDTFTARFVYQIPSSGFGNNTPVPTAVAGRIDVNGQTFEVIAPLSGGTVHTDDNLTSDRFFLRAFSSPTNHVSGPSGVPTPQQLALIFENNASLFNTPNYPQSNGDLNLAGAPPATYKLEIFDGAGSINRLDFSVGSFVLAATTSFPGAAAGPTASQPVPSSTWWSGMLLIMGIAFLGRRKLKIR